MGHTAAALTYNGWLQNSLAPLAECGRSVGRGRPGCGVINAFVLGRHHVREALSERLGHTAASHTALVGVDGRLLKVNGLAQNIREDFCHLIRRDVLRTEYRHFRLTCPCGVHQELCRYCGDVRSSDRRSFQVGVEWV